ncbi:killer cell lectin-like receptor subfamily F member 1 isoform X1 [Xiphophorus couchianus]|uniref:killer cell lectin-like receptor subfamily F member 1 isoform X1 n=1 Tax=Xiphophorus couchianus TaxID=32473 RepID=UPI001016C20A|nr:killer cell lectin-like receptor subfamily F member 1 isoform X1 [Xiphophorus couchianus]XP_027868966.1 killer cell lectin-like receptor subfamily F member 1 isoform X1 [Xiphophorus couchianus]XP_027868967.1 killer cell lectin-like receptor subfamily F member 1 isoform X1 [Xiphophorus couchianus]
MEEFKDEDIKTTVAVTNDQLPVQSEEEEAEKEQTAFTRSRLYLVGFGVLCTLVAGAAIYMGVKTTAQQDSINDLTTDAQNVMERRMTLMEDINYLIREKDTRCELCPLDWILYKDKCYLFYDKPAPWKTWEESRRFCKKRRADLVIIDDLQEQEFVNKHIKYYYDPSHGYWIGLQHVNNTWTWVDGRVNTLGFWAKNWISTPGPHAIVIPERNPKECWSKEENVFENKFICERDIRKF